MCVCDFCIYFGSMKFGLLLALLSHIYVGWRTYRLLPFPIWAKWLTLCVMMMALLSLVWLFVRNFQGAYHPTLDTILYNVGTSWTIVFLYLLLAFLLLDAGILLHLIPKQWGINSARSAIVVFGSVACLLAYGFVHYHSKERVALQLTTSKPLPRPLKLVMMSDVHLGYHIGKEEFSQWVNLINSEHPDLILIAGDIVDINLAPIRRQHLAEEFRRLKAPVYACYGNHEHFSPIHEVDQFYAEAGIHTLNDTVAQVLGINLVGRDDRSTGHRATLHSLMNGLDKNRFTLLIDHQPFHLEQAEREGVDFQFSGHTHKGQVWPISLITNAIYEKHHGEHRRGNTRYYISSGIGIWGGKFRIGTSSEYVVLTLSPAQSHQSK